MTVTPSDDVAVTVKFTVSYRRIAITMFGRSWTTKNPQAFIHAGFWISLDYLGHFIGGGGGNRTRVRKSSTDSSTYLAMLFDLTWHPPTGGLMTGESPTF
jgi:hypothetical protein